jgi:hypothetical protein
MQAMRRGKVLLFVVIAALLALQAAAASQTSRASFLVSLSGTVTKQWVYTATAQTPEGCTVRTSGAGTRKITFRSSDNSVVRTSRTGKTLVRFSGDVRALRETIQQSGTKTTKATTEKTSCDTTPHRLVCKLMTRSRSNRALRLVSRRAHHVTFKPATGLVPSEFFNTCPGEPTAVRGIAGSLDLAAAKLSEADLFDRAVGGMTLQGSSEVTTQALNGSAKVVQRVDWRLTLRRLGS